jgi:hypothetical protein
MVTRRTVDNRDTDAWTAFLRSLVGRGLSGVELVISDAHGCIKAAIATVFSGTSWQRCRTHYVDSDGRGSVGDRRFGARSSHNQTLILQSRCSAGV